MDERFDQFVDQFVDRMDDMMNPRRRRDCNSWRSEGKESENPFFKGYDETNVSFSGVVLGVEEESMPVYDTYIEDVIEDEEGFIGKRGFGEEENNMEDVVVVANDLFSSKIQTVGILICKKYQEEYLKVAPMDDKFGFKLIKVRDDDVSDDDYEEALIFDDDQYKDVIEKEEGFVDNYLNFQKDETNVSFSGVEEESMLVYDTDIEDAIEDEKGFVGKRG
ncbi:hypothetical protein Tco_1431930, partial [Tanacetum coccineum]